MNLLAQDFSAIQSNAGITPPTDLAGVIENLLPYIYGIAGIILLLNIISAGFKMMTSGGDPKAMQSAQAKLTTSLIGILILAVSFLIVQFIMNFLGIDINIFG